MPLEFSAGQLRPGHPAGTEQSRSSEFFANPFSGFDVGIGVFLKAHRSGRVLAEFGQ